MVFELKEDPFDEMDSHGYEIVDLTSERHRWNTGISIQCWNGQRNKDTLRFGK